MYNVLFHVILFAYLLASLLFWLYMGLRQRWIFRCGFQQRRTGFSSSFADTSRVPNTGCRSNTNASAGNTREHGDRQCAGFAKLADLWILRQQRRDRAGSDFRFHPGYCNAE